MVRYSAYGVPFGFIGGDADSDGDNDKGDTVDSAQIQTWIDASAYDVRGDIDLDGDVDSTDKTKATSVPLTGVSLGREVLSLFENTRGYGGYDLVTPDNGHWLARNRILLPGLGRWEIRDKIGYLVV